MTKDEALRLALEALESTGENDGYHGVDQYFDNVLVDKAITALRLAIDVESMASKSTYKEQLETKDEPVAWMNRHGACKTSLFREEEAGAKEEYTIPVYTTPPQRKPLTDEQIWDAYIAYVKAPVDIDCHVSDLHKFARAIESAHGIKE